MSTITTTYPVGGPEPKVPSPASASSRPWGFWATLGWFGGAVATYAAATVLVLFVYGIWQGSLETAHMGLLASLSSVIAMPAAALVLMLAARRGGSSVRDYLGLYWPRWRHVLIGLGLLATYWLAVKGFFYLYPALDQFPEIIKLYRANLDNPTALVLFWVVLVVTAPVAEEIIFRGFMMRGWSASRLGIAGAIVLTALTFALAHPQYNIATMLMVVGLGLLLGVMRWRSGSTVLTMMMHATWNFAAGVLLVMAA